MNFQDNLTVKRCQLFCRALNYRYAGVKSARKCYCGNTAPEKESISDLECSMPCSGNEMENCGGDWAIKVFSVELGKTQI